MPTLDLAFGEALIGADRIVEGLQRVQGGADKIAASDGPDSAAAILARGHFGKCLMLARRLDRATATLEAAVRDAEAAGLTPRETTSLRLDPRASAGRRGDGERVRALAGPAVASLAPDDPLRADAERLLAGLRPADASGRRFLPGLRPGSAGDMSHSDMSIQTCIAPPASGRQTGLGVLWRARRPVVVLSSTGQRRR